MLIGELSQKSGFSRDTIRYYKKIGLLKLPGKGRRENNYKEYSTPILGRLGAIRQLKDIGYTLAEVQQVINAYEAGSLDCAEGKKQVQGKIRLIDQQISQSTELKTRLVDAVADCPDSCKITDLLTNTLK